MKTKIAELFGIQYPVILPGMSWISVPELVAAVSNAGGIGYLATGPLSPAKTRQSIKRIRELTNKPFGVGATLLMPGAYQKSTRLRRESHIDGHHGRTRACRPEIRSGRSSGDGL